MKPLKSIRAVSFLLSMVVLSIFWACDTSNNTEETSKISTGQKANESKTKEILFFGNSLTAGYGLSEKEAFPALIQHKIDSLNLPFTSVNAGNSGETTAGGLNRIGWVLNANTAVFVLELGANDGLRGIPVESSKANLQSIIDSVRSNDPKTKIILAGMQVPPNMGKTYANNFKSMYEELARENEVHLIPFLLENVAGIPELNLEDGIHPTAEGQKIVANNVWEVLKKVIQ